MREGVRFIYGGLGESQEGMSISNFYEIVGFSAIVK